MMEENNIVKTRAKKAGYIAGIATFLGFSFVLFLPSTYGNPFSFLFIFGIIALAPVGMLGSFIFGWVVYFISGQIKNRAAYKIALIIFIVIGYLLGCLGLISLFRAMGKTKPYTNQIDTNRDGKIDKWVYDNNLSTIVTLDTDYDGTPDIKEYYDNADLIKKEYYKNGELIKTEKFPKVKNKPGKNK